ncbi:receptor-type adenylate cyclase [Trypanosoma cruzi]|nr:receptor-type adenylate cyclase [Trypanosoma cruzi]
MVTGWAVMMAAARQGPGLHKETGCCGGIPLLGWRLSTYALYLVLLLLLLPQSGVGQAACPEIKVKVLTLNVTDLPVSRIPFGITLLRICCGIVVAQLRCWG